MGLLSQRTLASASSGPNRPNRGEARITRSQLSVIVVKSSPPPRGTQGKVPPGESPDLVLRDSAWHRQDRGKDGHKRSPARRTCEDRVVIMQTRKGGGKAIRLARSLRFEAAEEAEMRNRWGAACECRYFELLRTNLLTPHVP